MLRLVAIDGQRVERPARGCPALPAVMFPPVAAATAMRDACLVAALLSSSMWLAVAGFWQAGAPRSGNSPP